MTQHDEKSTVARGAGVPLRVALYIALAASALLTMAGLPAIQQRVEAGSIAPIWLLAPALCFGLFLAIYVADRVWLLRFRNFPSGRALFQILFGIVFLMLLLPSSIREYRSLVRSRPGSDNLSRLMRHKEPAVRATACELAGFRDQAQVYLPALGRALTDRDPTVRQAAHQALMRATGQDFSADKQGQRALEQFLQERAHLHAPAAGPPPISPPGGSGDDATKQEKTPTDVDAGVEG